MLYLPACEQDYYTSNTWRVDIYPSTAAGIVHKKTKKTLFCFGGSTTGLDEETMRGFGADVLKKLDEGQSKSVVRTWANQQVWPSE